MINCKVVLYLVMYIGRLGVINTVFKIETIIAIIEK